MSTWQACLHCMQVPDLHTIKGYIFLIFFHGQIFRLGWHAQILTQFQSQDKKMVKNIKVKYHWQTKIMCVFLRGLWLKSKLWSWHHLLGSVYISKNWVVATHTAWKTKILIGQLTVWNCLDSLQLSDKFDLSTETVDWACPFSQHYFNNMDKVILHMARW